MKKIFLTSMSIVAFFINIRCSSVVGSNYELTKKLPADTPDMEIKFVSDTSAVFFMTVDKSVKQNIIFSKNKKYYLIINFIDKKNQLTGIEKGDTIVLFKKELHIYNQKRKLVFKKKNK